MSDLNIKNSCEIVFAAGCFWGVEYYLKKLAGVLETQVGYMGGHVQNPTYKEVCTGKTGHLEVLRVVYDSSRLSHEKLVKYFFEIHDFTQTNGQGPDIGSQYLSAVFYYTPEQRAALDSCVHFLKEKGYAVATTIQPADSVFWPAEDYHQDYYNKKGDEPYCHRHTPRFD